LSTAPSPSLTSPAPSKPSRLITLTNVFPATYPANDLTQSFIATLETHLGVSHTEIDVAELWTRTAPEGRDKSLVDWLADAPMSVLDHDFYNSLASFRERHAERFKPRLPYIEPRCRDQLRRGENVGKEDYTESLRRVGVFRDWFASQVLSKGSPEMAEAVVVVPVASADVEPRYRDERRPDADDGKGVAPGVLAAMLEAPLATVPCEFDVSSAHLDVAIIALSRPTLTPSRHVSSRLHVLTLAKVTTLTYPSPITGTDEQLPVSAGLIGPRGSESVLIRALEGSLRTAGARAVLSAGACVFGDEGLKDEQREALGQALSVGEDVAAAKMRIDIRIG
jgi:Asp-tRNA(Asn)/Glu-tRNA(Gln) amidotransferase A subunit family amidase